MTNCILQDNGRCKKTNGKDDGNCLFNKQTNRCNRKSKSKPIRKSTKKIRKSKSTKKIRKSKSKSIKPIRKSKPKQYLDDKTRLELLQSNILFDNTEFIVNPKTFEIEYPNVITNKKKCKTKDTEYFLNCFHKIGSGSFATFYSRKINDYFGIRKVSIDKYSFNEIKVLTLLRNHFYDFIFCTHMYGWIKYKNHLYIILEQKHSDFYNYIETLHNKNINKELKEIIPYNTNMFLTTMQIISLQLKEFNKYGLYHQDLHQSNLLLLKTDTPINIKFKGYTFKTDIIPYIHDFDYTGIRDKKKQTNNINNIKWEDMYETYNKKVYLYTCYDMFEIYNSLMELFILEKNNTFYFLLDFEYIVNNLFTYINDTYVYCNGNGRYIKYKNKKINIHFYRKENKINIINYDIITKKEKQIKLQIYHKNGYKTNNIVISYSTLNTMYENINEIEKMYSPKNILLVK